MQTWETITGAKEDDVQRQFRSTRYTLERIVEMEDETLIKLYGEVEAE
jgi:hypothetical protein